MIRGLVEKSFKWVEVSDNKGAAIEQQFVSLLGKARSPSMRFDEDDVLAAMGLLNSSASPFSASQGAALRNALTESFEGHPMCKDGSISGSQQQIHEHMENYLTQNAWDVLLNRTVPIENKVRSMAEAMKRIGLVNPKEIPTQKRCVGVVVAAHGRERVSEKKAYELVEKLRDIMAALRKSNCERSVRCRQYPATAEEYLKIAPKAYKPDAPPVTCPLDLSEIEAGTKATPTRNTHSGVRPERSSLPRETVTSSAAGSNDGLSSVIQKMLFEGLMNSASHHAVGTPQQKPKGPAAQAAVQTPAPKAPHVAEDTPPAVVRPEEERDCEVDGGSDKEVEDDDIDSWSKKILGDKVKGKGKAKAKAKPKAKGKGKAKAKAAPKPVAKGKANAKAKPKAGHITPTKCGTAGAVKAKCKNGWTTETILRSSQRNPGESYVLYLDPNGIKYTSFVKASAAGFVG